MGDERSLGFMPRGAWRSLVSALVWGTRGPEFESRRPDRKGPFCGPFPLLEDSELAMVIRFHVLFRCV
jgi:hypothetical protein